MIYKDKILTIRISKKLLEEYKSFCDENSINMSQRLRKYIERDLEMWRLKKQKGN